MSDQLGPMTVLTLIVRTFTLSLFTVVGLCLALSNDPSCSLKEIGALVGMASGSVLFAQVACAKIARHYRGSDLVATQGE